MKILLLGKDGQVGWELQRSLTPLGHIIALATDSQDYCGDLTNLQGLSETIKRIQPDVIVNAAAYTAVDQAETECDLAKVINTDAPRILAQEAKKIGALLVHYSTDYVFDGSGTDPWQETDNTQPLNIYGETKLAGEIAIQEAGCKHLIFRTSWVYGVRGNNFAKTMLRLAVERESLSVIDDQFGAPTGADLLADVTAHIIWTVYTTKPELTGLYHLVAAGEATWYSFAKLVIDTAIKSGLETKVGLNDILPVKTIAFPTPAIRPHNSRMDTTKVQITFGLVLPDWQIGVTRMLTEFLEEKK